MFILWFFGFYRICIGHILIGIIQLLIGGGFFIWSFIYLIMVSINGIGENEASQIENILIVEKLAIS